MHIHKIESHKHQDFLLQNRIDPITGDLIVENDEVVFCASCKSVFLVDTWLYLNKQHCEQSQTLKKISSSSVIHLKVEENILFYQTLSNSTTGSSKIPKEVKKKPWIKKQNKISSFQNFFHHPLVTSIKVLAWIVGIALYFAYQSPIVMFAFSITFILKISEILHNWYFGNKSDSIYKLFKSNTFYITNKSICFSEAYGMNIYNLPLENIKKIHFNEWPDFVSCVIYYQNEKKDKKLYFTLPKENSEKLISFVDSLKLASNSIQLPIQIKSRSATLSSHIQRLIVEGNSNFKLVELE